MKINISTGERAELLAPGASYTSCAIHVATQEADRNICEVTIENGCVTKVFVHDAAGRRQVFENLPGAISK